jgi:hypothetical protein
LLACSRDRSARRLFIAQIRGSPIPAWRGHEIERRHAIQRVQRPSEYRRCMSTSRASAAPRLYAGDRHARSA